MTSRETFFSSTRIISPKKSIIVSVLENVTFRHVATLHRYTTHSYNVTFRHVGTLHRYTTHSYNVTFRHVATLHRYTTHSYNVTFRHVVTLHRYTTHSYNAFVAAEIYSHVPHGSLCVQFTPLKSR